MQDPDTAVQRQNTLPSNEAPQLTPKAMLILAVQIFHTNRKSYMKRLADPLEIPIVAEEIQEEITAQAIKRLYGSKDNWRLTMNRVDSLPILNIIDVIKQEMNIKEQ